MTAEPYEEAEKIERRCLEGLRCRSLERCVRSGLWRHEDGIRPCTLPGFSKLVLDWDAHDLRFSLWSGQMRAWIGSIFISALSMHALQRKKAGILQGL